MLKGSCDITVTYDRITKIIGGIRAPTLGGKHTDTAYCETLQ